MNELLVVILLSASLLGNAIAVLYIVTRRPRAGRHVNMRQGVAAGGPTMTIVHPETGRDQTVAMGPEQVARLEQVQKEVDARYTSLTKAQRERVAQQIFLQGQRFLPRP